MRSRHASLLLSEWNQKCISHTLSRFYDLQMTNQSVSATLLCLDLDKNVMLTDLKVQKKQIESDTWCVDV